jgi:hypothetical protein
MQKTGLGLNSMQRSLPASDLERSKDRKTKLRPCENRQKLSHALIDISRISLIDYLDSQNSSMLRGSSKHVDEKLILCS